MKRNFFSELWVRLQSDTPSFFNKLKVFGGSLSAFGIAMNTIPNVPLKITSVTGDLIWVGAAIVAVCALVVKNPDDLKK
jgi:hypothetical protein